ncbi:MAG: ATP-dependent sacrificial sulfur transferase LarE [Nitrospirae bacterium]|nr:ATP-dependent sacrificial sulfur transferase LarE [Nitrospirota bacterium]MBI3352084.1 ATP-dependent sacrificial sulfur transferase LarE [Nitrospirota bacterium]
MLDQKFQRLKQLIAQHHSLLVAFSGGVDSALLLKVSHDVLGEKAAACTAVSPTLAQQEKESTLQVAGEIGANHFFIEYDELDIPGYSLNQENRCYLCKTELFTKLKELALEKGFQAVAYGANQDDLKEFRPGMKAAREFGIHAPLLDAGLNKEEIRTLSRRLGLSIWNKPAAACLSSRIPYGTEITHQRLTEIEAAEAVLKKYGFIQCRVRHHENIARIEVSREEFPRLLDPGLRESVVQELKKIGFQFITLDLEGYRPGSVSGITGINGKDS